MIRFSAVFLLIAVLLASPVLSDDGNGVGSSYIVSTPIMIGGNFSVNWGQVSAPGAQTLLLMSDSAASSTHPALPYPLCINLYSPGFSIISQGFLDAQGQSSFSAAVPNVPSFVGFPPLYFAAVVVDFSVPGFLSIPKTMRASFENPDSSSPTGLMTEPRALHTATRMGEGTSNYQKVLIAGGGSGTLLSPVATMTTEIYDPLSNTFSPGPALSDERTLHSATLLQDGRILLVGGTDTIGTVKSTVEAYDPATNTITAVASLPGPRAGHVATRLPSGKVLVTGGLVSFAGGTTSLAAILNGGLDTAVVYDPAADFWTAVGNNMSSVRFAHGQLAISGYPGADVLVSGGISAGTTIFGQDVPVYNSTVDMYSEASNSFIPAASFSTPRAGHGLSQLGNGSVLMTGGIVAGFLSIPTASSSCQVWSGSNWTPVASLSTPRGMHQQTTLPNGDALLTGGLTGTFLFIGVTAETGVHNGSTYSVNSLLGTNIGNQSASADPRGTHTMTLLCDGTYLVVGGADANTGLSTAYRYVKP